MLSRRTFAGICIGAATAGRVLDPDSHVQGSQSFASSTRSADDWKEVEAAMGRSGQMQSGGVIRFGMPRKDLHVVLDDVEIKPGLALGS